MITGAFWFADTVGGEARLGQIFRYTPGTNGRPGSLELWGPSPEPSTARRRRLAVAPPPSGFVPGLDDDLLEASRQAGLTPYEAAALRSFGVPAEAR